jgi:hypothetical protein
VVAKLRETLSVAVLKFDTERFDLKKLRNVGERKKSVRLKSPPNLPLWKT